MDNCLFCKIVHGEIPSEKIYEDDATFAFLDIKPLNDGHTLVVPKQHHENIFDVSDDALGRTMETVRCLAPIIRDSVGADGMNVNSNHGSAAGQIVGHMHVHLIPRFEKDGYRHWHRETPATPLPEVREKILATLETCKKS